MSQQVEPPPGTPASAGRSRVGVEESARAGRIGWDRRAEDYLEEHAAHLGGAADLVWGPEGLREEDAHLLGEVAGRRVLEVGCGAAQCTRWLGTRGAEAVGIDISGGMLRHSVGLDAEAGVRRTAVTQADARALPFGRAVFDVAFTSYGALPFVADPPTVHAEVARVLRPAGRWVFSLTHPIRWAFPDDPGPPGLTATTSYFDKTPYVERDDAGRAIYVEHHRTLGDVVRDLRHAGFGLVDLIEPAWPAERSTSWGGWSPLRGALIPGTAIFVCRRT